MFLGGVILEQDENKNFIPKQYNPAEANKQKALEEEQEPKQSLVTASMLAQQAKARQSNENAASPNNNYLLANSVSGGQADITPSF